MTLLLGLDLADREVVAVGGGPVSARRVADFLAAGARVHLVAPYACEDLVDLVADRRITWAQRDVRPSDLDGAWLVHTATGDRLVDAEVRRTCDERRVWCVDATDGSASRVRVPARAEVDTPDGPVRIGVLAGDPGRSRTVAAGVEDVLTGGGIDVR